MKFFSPKIGRGFTLIELLVVIAIIGVLAGVMIVIINPLEQLARGRDAGRKQTVSQLGNSIQGYYASQNAYPTQNATWLSTLQTAGELKALPTNPTSAGYTTGCNTAGVAQNGYCYQTSLSGTDAMVYARAESKSFTTTAGCVGSTVAWIVWSSAEGKAGLVCLTLGSDPVAGTIYGLK
ncbi:MAG TPA: type II secretion system protein [Patescibacteria group bacterium]